MLVFGAQEFFHDAERVGMLPLRDLRDGLTYILGVLNRDFDTKPAITPLLNPISAGGAADSLFAGAFDLLAFGGIVERGDEVCDILPLLVVIGEVGRVAVKVVVYGFKLAHARRNLEYRGQRGPDGAIGPRVLIGRDLLAVRPSVIDQRDGFRHLPPIVLPHHLNVRDHERNSGAPGDLQGLTQGLQE